MNKQFIFALMIAIVASQTYSTTLCSSCDQLLSQGDCTKMTGCSWDATKNTCGITTTPVTPTVTYAAYCDSFAEADCPKAEPCQGCGTWAACAWDGGKCVQFTGCTAYAKTTDPDCQAISNRCITDGTHCVEIDVCSSYSKQLPCVNNISGNLCYWEATTNACVDANTCDKLPTTFATDADCRGKIPTCTAKTGGGCVDSGTNCGDQLLEIQCVWNKLYNQKCYWDGAKCWNKTCDVAPTTLTTDDACKAFLDNGSCTTKSGGGCVARGACTDVIQAACVKNSNGGDCYWNTLTSKCVEKTCANAPTSMTTNTACSGFAPLPANGCIAKSGGGCIPNSGCSTATFKDACIKNSLGQDCIWDTTCKEKTCQNSPITNNTHDLCTLYLPTCTVKTGGGCQPRSCSNAPTTNTTNDACETYYPSNKCITIPNGGCTINTTCSAILLKTACIKDANNNVCFYDDASSTCKDKTCANAPSVNTTHELCQGFLTSCTVNSTSNPTGCVTWTCENALAQAICTQDTSQKPCIWKGKCYKKQCALAPSTTSTHNDCNAYLNTCTLSNTGSGCVPIPLKCEAITIEAACQVRQGGSICGWNGTGCIDKACTTAPKTLTLTTDCSNYKAGCVSANNGSGCIDLPAACASRMSSDNCSQGTSPVCLWNGTKCIEKTCDVATLDGTPSKVTASDTNCNTFLPGCLVSDDGTKCIPKVTSCGSLHSISNCIKNAKSGTGYCYWNGTTCVDRTCTNINKNSHSLCNTELDSCTVNAAQNNCMALATACSNYTISDQCNINSTGKLCVWTGTVCRNATCYDAENSASYNTDSECVAYKAVTDTCAVVYKVGGLGCIPKAANCTDYYIQAQCHKTLSNTSANDDCVWVNNGCSPISTWATGDCTTFKGTQASCQAYRLGCSNVIGALATAFCTFDCTRKTGSGLSHTQCSSFNALCTTVSGGANCQASSATCGGYSASTSCTYTTAGAKCYWYNNGTSGDATDDVCISITTISSDCLKVTGSSLTNAICTSYNSGCTSNLAATACQVAKTCSQYSADTECTYNTAGLQCKWYNDGSNNKCIDITASSDCAKITGSGLTHAQCQVYNTLCSANSAGSACLLVPTCGSFSTSASCTYLGSIKCYWYATTSSCIAIATASTDCLKITGTGLTDDSCNDYNASCTANVAGTACQEKLSTCAGYTGASAQASCSVATDGKCYWYATTPGCIAILTASLAADCPKVAVSGLTHDSCQAYNVGCTVNVAGNACQEKKSTCAGYTLGTAQASCSLATEGKCFWNATPACQAIADGTGCATVTGLTGLTPASCQAYNKACTSNSGGTACQAVTACGDFTSQANCLFFAAVKCYWYTTGTPACIPITAVGTDCLKVTGSSLTHSDCVAYNAGCTVNAAGTACQEKKSACSGNSASTSCSFANTTPDICFWDASTSACAVYTYAGASDCTKITGTGLTDAKCVTYNTACTVNLAGTACQLASPCSSYTTSATCTFDASSNACLWYNNGTASDTSDDKCIAVSGKMDCEKHTAVSGLTNDLCSPFNSACRAVTAGTSCYTVNQCSDIKSSGLCTQVGTTKCYWSSTLSCIAIATSSDCAKVTGGVGLTFENCQSYNIACSVNRAGTDCIAIQATCSSYTTPAVNCVKSTAGVCVSSTSTDTSACQLASVVTTCEGIYLGAGRYTNANCNAAKAGCTNNSSTGCTARTCANYVGTPTGHSDCNAWLNTCTSNSTPSACVIMATTCSPQAGTTSACLQATEGACVVSGSSCVKKTCDTAINDSTHNSDSLCSSYLSTCTVARVGGCQPRAACSTYKSSLQCNNNSTGGACFWNPTQLTCVDLSCGNVEATAQFDTHGECYAVDATLKCTVRATNGAAAAGCMARGTCSSYAIEEQCKTNSAGGECVWNTNLTTPACQDRGCTTAPNATATHADCLAYYSSTTPKVFCTVVATPNPAGGLATLGGCQQTVACSSYLAEEQCKINANGDFCGWNGQTCADKSCATAQSTVNTDTLCKGYLPNCTVADTGSGCIDIPVECSGLGTAANCISNKSGALCYWTGQACQTRTCDNAPDSAATADDCNTHLAGCTLDSTKCKTKICEDFVFTTDALCKQQLGTCTTDGTKCVSRGTCFQALNEAGCVTAAPIGSATTGKACQWIAATSTAVAYCTEKTCATAPVASYTTESQCAGYCTNGTTKSGGGCAAKTTCAAANIDAACTTALDGTVCQWDNNACRNKDCQDFTGSTHSACQGQRSGCTAGANGKCAKVKNCEDTTVRAACIQGSNGPCLWVSGYANSDGTKGACFSYTSCKSLKWNNDINCKLASKKCTTDGSKCVGISLCSETNTAGGCVTGYDGDCIQSIASLTSPGPAVCKAYTSCADAFYLTHTACQTASIKCTTNGSTGCIALAACSTYAKEGCVINNVGSVVASVGITSTGICKWDDGAVSCRDQNCQDLVGTTHSQCVSQLSTCTSDGTNCLVKGNCSTYQTQTACATAVGADGTCYWEAISATNTTAKCRLMTCDDIANGTSTSVCQTALSTCVSDGTNCITKANCQIYKTKTSCNSAGSDGICVFAPSTVANATAGNGSCALMTACTTANSDQTACTAAKDRCKWTAATTSATNTTTPSSCATHTCASYQATNGVCTRYLSWDKKTQQICTVVNATCTATDPSKLQSADCYSISGYTYTWNAKTNGCTVCTAVVVQPNNTNNTNTTNNTNDTTTTSGYILGFASVVLGYLVF